MKAPALRPAVVIEDGQVRVMQAKKQGKSGDFDMDRFLAECAEVEDDEDKATLKTYEDGEMITVKVKSVTYDTIFAESIDPAYTVVTGPIRIIGASNVRGLYMTDFARNMRVGDVINVEYLKEQECFSIDDTVIDLSTIVIGPHRMTARHSRAQWEPFCSNDVARFQTLG